MTPCTQCHTAAQHPHSGLYNFACVQCCARLVSSTKPDKAKASAMLGSIARFKPSPPRPAILAALR
jgi:hypothetical protein